MVVFVPVGQFLDRNTFSPAFFHKYLADPLTSRVLFAAVLMSQPKEKRARVQQEPGSSLSFLQRTPSEDSAEAISGSAGLSDKKSMEIADTTPVQAVVLARTSRDAQSGIVLLSRDTFPRRLDTYAAPDVRTASDLAVYAKARAQDDYKRSLEFEGPAKVYDYNPTRVDPRALEEGNDVSLDLRRKALPNNTVLHGHLEPDTHEIVDTFFVLVTAFEKQRAEEKGEGEQSYRVYLVFVRIRLIPSGFAFQKLHRRTVNYFGPSTRPWKTRWMPAHTSSQQCSGFLKTTHLPRG